jgi:hypothetical protein
MQRRNCVDKVADVGRRISQTQVTGRMRPQHFEYLGAGPSEIFVAAETNRRAAGGGSPLADTACLFGARPREKVLAPISDDVGGSGNAGSANTKRPDELAT